MMAMRLEHGGYRLDCLAEEGGLIRRLQWRDSSGQWRDLILPPSDLVDRTAIDRASPRRFGLWPLVPFCNRAFGAVMLDGTRRIALPVNDPATGSCIHGFGWQAEWRVKRQGEDRALLVHERGGADDPYAYRAEMALALDAGGLRISLSVENRTYQPLPFGIGLHPWFPAADGTSLRMRNDAELALGPGYRATGVRKFHDGGPYATGPLFQNEVETAHSFIGWDGAAVIETPSQGLAIHVAASESLLCPVVWAPPQADFLCLEPQSHGIGAPSERPASEATPMARLKPGESLSGWMRISARALA
jgi:aldose 1-epimerase